MAALSDHGGGDATSPHPPIAKRVSPSHILRPRLVELATAVHERAGAGPAAQADACAEAWSARRLLRFVEPIEGMFWADQARRLAWARTRPILCAYLLVTLVYPVRLSLGVWDSAYGNGHALATVATPLAFGLLGVAASMLAGRDRCWAWLGGGPVTPALRFRLGVLSVFGWTAAIAGYTMWTLTWCVSTGTFINADPDCADLAQRRVPYRLFAQIAPTNLVLGLVLRFRWWVSAVATSALAFASTAIVLARVTGAEARTLSATSLLVLAMPFIAAYAAEKQDREQYLLKLAHRDQEEQTLKWQSQFHEAQLKARAAEKAMLRRTLGFILHECGNVLHGMLSVIDGWAAAAASSSSSATGSTNGGPARGSGSVTSLAGLDPEISAALGDFETSDDEEATRSITVQHEDVRIVAFGVASLRQLCADGLDAQKLAAGRLQVHQTLQHPVRLARTVARAYRLTSSVPIRFEVEPLRADTPLAVGGAGDAGAAAHVSLDGAGTGDAVPTLPMAWIDAHRARQILVNGVTNAIKLCHHGQITVRVGVRHVGDPESGPSSAAAAPAPSTTATATGPSSGGKPAQPVERTGYDADSERPLDVVFTVEDTGPGLRGATPESLFRDFTQSSDARVAAKGSGLGLPLARRLVRLMGGSIGLEEDKERGVTRFWFSLPAERPSPGSRTTLALVEAARSSVSAPASPSAHGELTVVGGGKGNGAAGNRSRGAWTAGGGPPHALVVSIPSPVALGGTGRADEAAWPSTPTPAIPVMWFDEGESEDASEPGDEGGVGDDDPARPLGLHVAVCDDEPLNLKIAARLLRDVGCSCETFADGEALLQRVPTAEEGLCAAAAGTSPTAGGSAGDHGGSGGGVPSKITCNTYDAVLLDAVMTRSTGPDVARTLRGRGLAMPIFAVTANVAAHDLQLYKDAGMNAVLPKPFRAVSLRQLLQRHVLDVRHEALDPADVRIAGCPSPSACRATGARAPTAR